jgi:superfamily II DNA or RNA helicase
LSTLTIPTDRPILILACHQSLTSQEAWNRLPTLEHIHYDEVHRITGEELFTHLTAHVLRFPCHLTGTSATPKTADPQQQKRITELFGDAVLHHCSVEEAVREGWIARPRFMVELVPAETQPGIRAFVDAVVRANARKGGKAIAYLSSRTEEAMYAYRYAQTTYPTLPVYLAMEDATIKRNDEAFVHTTERAILFSCQRYREGSDIKGVEVTACLIRDSIAAHLCLQIMGSCPTYRYKRDKQPKQGGMVYSCTDGGG